MFGVRTKRFIFTKMFEMWGLGFKVDPQWKEILVYLGPYLLTIAYAKHTKD